MTQISRALGSARSICSSIPSHGLSDANVGDMAKSILATIIASVLGRSLQDEVPMIRDYLQVGGQYVENSAGEHVLADQIYVEHLLPIGGSTQPQPLIMIHGSAQTATVSTSLGHSNSGAQLIEVELVE